MIIIKRYGSCIKLFGKNDNMINYTSVLCKCENRRV